MKSKPNLDDEALVDENVAAEVINLSPRTLQAKRLNGEGPRFIRISRRCVRYRMRDVLDWLSDHRVIPTRHQGQKP